MYSFIKVAAEACARATIKLRTSTLAGAQTSTTGHVRASRASSESCGLSAAVTEAIAEATAAAVANAFAESNNGKVRYGLLQCTSLRLSGNDPAAVAASACMEWHLLWRHRSLQQSQLCCALHPLSCLQWCSDAWWLPHSIMCYLLLATCCCLPLPGSSLSRCAGRVAHSQKCEAFSDADGKAAVSAIARAITSGFASTHVSANSRGNGRSEATGYALFQGDVGVYAKAIGRFVARACSRCGPHCSFCQGLGQHGEAESTTDSFTIAAKGEFALASAMSDALANVCDGKVSIRAAVKAILKAHAQVCMQLTAKAWGTANSAGTATACTNSVAAGNATALAYAYGELWAGATAKATKGHDCEAEALSELNAKVASQLNVFDFVKATSKACAETDDEHEHVSADDIAEVVAEGQFDRFGESLADAFGIALQHCECKGAGYCCNCEKRKCHW